MTRFELIVLLASVSASPQCGAQDPTTFSGPHGLLAPKKVAERSKLEALVRVLQPVVAVGASVTIACEVRCMGGSEFLFNPFFLKGHKLPALVTITSADGLARYELLPRWNVDVARTDAMPWVRLHESRSIGREFVVGLANSENQRGEADQKMTLDLRPGEYYVQAIYSHWLMAHWPNGPFGSRRAGLGDRDEEPQPLPWLSVAQMGEPLLISAPAKFVVVAERRADIADAKLDDRPLRVELLPAKISAKAGRRVEVEIRFSSTANRAIEMFNPMLDQSLAIYNRTVKLDFVAAEGRRAKDLLRTDEGSFRGPIRNDWASIPSGGIISTRFNFLAGEIPGARFESHAEAPPGTYSLQLVVHGHALSDRPSGVRELHGQKAEAAGIRPTFQEWERSFPGPEICRSNRVELEILPRTGD